MLALNATLMPALVTPFNPDGSVDYEGAARLAKRLVHAGCDGILVNGTTGEAPTLTLEERLDLVRAVRSTLSGQGVPVMSGVGSNNTAASAQDAQRFVAAGADALLVVVPYYSKPSQRGLVEHFIQVADAIPATPIVIYNIPGRCGVLMGTEAMAELHARCPNVVGVKQSHPDMDAVSELVATLPRESWTVWSGDDSLTLPMLACGAKGVISVAAHLVAPALRELLDAFARGDARLALERHLSLLHVNREIFFLPNPTVVKTCLAELGHIHSAAMRLPMVAAEGADLERIRRLAATLRQDRLAGLPA